MANSGKKDPKLSEVRAVLRRLQGLSTDEDRAEAALAERRATGRAMLLTMTIVISLGAAIFGVVLFIGFKVPRGPERPPESAGKTPVSTPTDQLVVDTKQTPPDIPLDRPAATSASAVKPALDVALDLMAKGRVRAARERLLELTAGGPPHADVAWALARSYDPNYLLAIPTADADPDVEEATRWYRAWYAAAVRQGLVADSVSLERVIGSMRR